MGNKWQLYCSQFLKEHEKGEAVTVDTGRGPRPCKPGTASSPGPGSRGSGAEVAYSQMPGGSQQGLVQEMVSHIKLCRFLNLSAPFMPLALRTNRLCPESWNPNQVMSRPSPTCPPTSTQEGISLICKVPLIRKLEELQLCGPI